MRKIVTFLLMLLITTSNMAFADSINKTLTTLGVNKSAISISIKDLKSGETVYSLNDKAPKNPASTLKLITTSAAFDTLGSDYKYKTTLYKSTNNDLYLKLSADPLLKTSDLEQLILKARDKAIAPKTFYIDYSVFDEIEWGEGWQWDDEFNIRMPKFSAYNLDNNLLKIEVTPTSNNRPASIAVKPFYPLSFMNMVVTNTSAPTSVNFQKNNTIANNMINATGSVAKTYQMYMPVPNPQRYFSLRLEELIRNKKFEYFAPLKNGTLPKENIYVVDTIEHDISTIIPIILRNSNNYMAETLFKTAGAVWSDSTGTRENSLNMLNNYLDNLKIQREDIKIVDGSGVSKNNLMSADFMTEFLYIKSKQDDFEEFKTVLPTPGIGTLKNRMLYFKDNLYAKTGTLSDTSSIAGYLTSRRGKSYAFDIMICDAKTSEADKKNIEEQILRIIYTNY